LPSSGTYTAAPITLIGAAQPTIIIEGTARRESAFVLSGVLGTFNPAQPDTPKGIAKTQITIKSDSEKNKGTDDCQ
jgi:hypothetical protein